MDRFNRLGQHKVVNVHCLIMRGKLEKKTMGLQNFKISVANAVINAENDGIRNIAPSADISCSSGLNGSDLEKMSERQRMNTFPECHRHLEYCLDSEPKYPPSNQT